MKDYFQLQELLALADQLIARCRSLTAKKRKGRPRNWTAHGTGKRNYASGKTVQARLCINMCITGAGWRFMGCSLSR